MKNASLFLVFVFITLMSCEKSEEVKTTGRLKVIANFPALKGSIPLRPIDPVEITLEDNTNNIQIQQFKGENNQTYDFGELNPGFYLVKGTAWYTMGNLLAYENDKDSFQIVANVDKTITLE